MKKIIALILCFVTIGAFCVTSCAAKEESTALELEIDVNNRYTDISEMDDYNDVYLDIDDAERDARESRKMIYIVILCVLLVVAVVILAVSLKRVPAKEDEDNNADVKVDNKASDESACNNLADEEKEE